MTVVFVFIFLLVPAGAITAGYAYQAGYMDALSGKYMPWRFYWGLEVVYRAGYISAGGT